MLDFKLVFGRFQFGSPSWVLVIEGEEIIFGAKWVIESVLEEVWEPEDRRDLMATLPELVLKDSCTGCGATLDLYGSSCRHLTLCVKCGKSMAETAAPCSDCGVPITRLIRVWSLHPFSSTLSFFLFHLPHNRDAARKLRLIMFGVWSLKFLASGFVTTGLKWNDFNQALGLELNYGVFLSFFWLSCHSRSVPEGFGG